ncbi:MAG: 3-oxoacyl-ACP synthase [Dactylosporangium sp.]|nr:3-oxoacyl-ACP synthase [Dactylosporangium sp.]
MGRSYPVRVLGTGAYLPRRKVMSTALDAEHGRPPGTAQARSGVRQRHWADASETSSRMAAAAVRDALTAAGLGPADLDAVIAASVVPEQPMPTNAVLTLRELGMDSRCGDGVEGFDVNASCLGFLTAFELATLGIAAGRWDTVAVVATEIASKALNHRDVESSALFGDGAAAAILGRAPDGDADPQVLSLRFETWSDGADLCQVAGGGTRWNVVTPPPDPRAYLFAMDGLGIMKLAAGTLPAFLSKVLAQAGTTLADIDVIVPHQVSHLGLRYLRERLGAPAEKVVDLLETHGNQVSASLPTALHAAVASGRLRRGDTALLLGSAAGLSIGAAVLRF